MRYQRTRTALAIIGISTLVVILGGCGASGQIEPQLTPRVLRDATKCAEQYERCFFVHATNDTHDRMTVYMNGFKVGEVESHSKRSFPVPVARLRDGNCAIVSLVLFPSGLRGSSDKQCLRDGGFFDLQLDVQRHIWLVPWGGR